MNTNAIARAKNERITDDGDLPILSPVSWIGRKWLPSGLQGWERPDFNYWVEWFILHWKCQVRCGKKWDRFVPYTGAHNRGSTNHNWMSCHLKNANKLVVKSLAFNNEAVFLATKFSSRKYTRCSARQLVMFWLPGMSSQYNKVPFLLPRIQNSENFSFTAKPVLNGHRIKRTSSIKQTVAKVPKFISLIYFKWNLY